ncbi:hypothetical protein G7Y89_g7107 [Cudoniella acicularis]|uniref:DUF1754-domain-containing protein n=1 Tax=Cudoniella acicularis TaxID=354080 RepID=A0A8H4RMP1_9HELO|nr:hypothetical protein G7Y89_g7107 [Cudoniella acicularis]
MIVVVVNPCPTSTQTLHRLHSATSTRNHSPPKILPFPLHSSTNLPLILFSNTTIRTPPTIMTSDDYAPIVRGGLKLKGAKPTGVTKTKKKKKDKLSTNPQDPSSSTSKDVSKTKKDAEKEGGKEGEGEEEELTEEQLRTLEERGGDGKTASERAYEEMRKKRLQDRLAREGPKTHKQRVEELNKYLSNLSEHHDMPRIGPG